MIKLVLNITSRLKTKLEHAHECDMARAGLILIRAGCVFDDVPFLHFFKL